MCRPSPEEIAAVNHRRNFMRDSGGFQVDSISGGSQSSPVISTVGGLRAVERLHLISSLNTLAPSNPGIMNRLSIRIEFEPPGGNMGSTMALLPDSVREGASIRKAGKPRLVDATHPSRLTKPR